MKYSQIVKGHFLERPNRFIARVEVGGVTETVHVKNTGRCRELLQKGACVYLEKSDNPNRSTACDLVAVEKGGRMINMDSQAPNKAVEEWLREGDSFLKAVYVQPEFTYGNSRFDFYIEADDEKIFMEVKGVTLEEDGVARFPDAPSQRALKHVEELITARQEGYRACMMFVIQMEGVRYFTPNKDTQPEFADALCRAKEAGVELYAYDCLVTQDSMKVNQPVPVVLQEENVNESFRKELEKSKLDSISIPLLKWYDKNKRVLPWRSSPTPYRVWVSEIMLQQTRVEAVKPYFERFMKKLPDIASLAGADEETLLKLWEGLGYYNRVRNLQKAAVQIQRDYGGRMPGDYEELLTLSGIGSYTAGAIASIAFGQMHPAVDGNVLRVVARLCREERPVSDGKVRQAIEKELESVMPAKRPGDFNQALMEIGACVCIPNGAPLCGSCPLADLCEAHKTGEEKNYPRKQPKKPRQIEERTVLVIKDGRHTALRKRPEGGLLAGMYEYPSLEGFCTAQEVAAFLADNGLKTVSIQALEDAKHIFTHREWHMKGYMVTVEKLEPECPGDFVREWLYPDSGETKYPVPAAFKAYSKYAGGV